MGTTMEERSAALEEGSTSASEPTHLGDLTPVPEEPAEDKKAATTYVLLGLREDLCDAHEEPVLAWEEIARIKAASREAAWEEAKRRCPGVLPTEDGAESHAQLVPDRFFRKITATLRRPEPQVEVEGL